jgi:hypothetical protein
VQRLKYAARQRDEQAALAAADALLLGARPRVSSQGRRPGIWIVVDDEGVLSVAVLWVTISCLDAAPFTCVLLSEASDCRVQIRAAR